MLAILNDTHFSARNNNEHIAAHQEEFYTEVFFPYLVKNDIKEILHLGDFFDDRKKISVKALNSTRRMFLEPMARHGMKMTIIPGNHDLLYNNTSDVCSLIEVFTHDSVEIVTNPCVKEFGPVKVALVPWINSGNYHESMDFLLSTSNVDILAGHFEIQGFEMQAGGYRCEHGLSRDLFDRFPLTLSGHFHTKSEHSGIHYLGTQYELTWADYGDAKYFHVIGDDKKLKAIRNPNTLHVKLVYNDEAPDVDIKSLNGKIIRLLVLSRTNDDEYKDFISKLNAVGPAELTITDNHIFMSEEAGDDFTDVKVESNIDILRSYVQNIGLETDLEASVKKYVQELYDASIQLGGDE